MKKTKFLFLSTVLLSCGLFGSRTTAFHFHNLSDKHIDSVVFKINGYRLSISDIKPKDLVFKEINQESVKTNPHDYMIIADIFVGGKIFKGAYFYSDLGGNLDEKYTLILRGDLTVVLKSGNE